MARPGYMSIYADEKTQRIFNEFINIKGITKSTALSEMMEIYMLSQDDSLYLDLKKQSLNIERAKHMILQKDDTYELNDYIFMKLGDSHDIKGKLLDGEKTIEAYIKNIEENDLGYTWFSTQSLHFGMSKKKVAYYNKLIHNGEKVTILFAVGMNINDIVYSATVKEIVSSKDQITCPECPEAVPKEYGSEETGKIWIKISNIKKETKLKAAMMAIRSTDANLKEVITNSQFHFGYVYLQK